MPESETYPLPKNEARTIKEWREDERPRERLLKHGSETLSDAELLAIIIGSGTRGFSAMDAARDLLSKYQSLSELTSCDLSQIKQVKGIGNVRAIVLEATFELARRIQSIPISEDRNFRSPEDVAAYFIPRLRGLKKEVFRVILLNSSNQMFRDVVVSEGILNASLVHPREVFRIAITEQSASIIVMHNHPSGNPEPSKEDISITKKLVEAGKLIDIKVADHIIIAGDKFSSFAKLGLI